MDEKLYFKYGLCLIKINVFLNFFFFEYKISIAKFKETNWHKIILLTLLRIHRECIILNLIKLKPTCKKKSKSSFEKFI